MNAIFFPIGPSVVAVVAVAMAYDLQTRRIPNWLVAAALIAALPVQVLANGMPIGPLWWMTGALTGGLLFVPGYLMRMLGAGDVKLMAAVGALLGPRGALEAVLAATAAGGVLSFLALMQRRRVRRGMASAMTMLIAMTEAPTQGAAPYSSHSENDATSIGTLPYGVAIAIGTVITLVINA